jgi:hypothetical protein
MRFVLVMMFVSMPSHFALRTSHFFEMDIKLHAGDAGFLLARDVKMIAAERQLLQLSLQLAVIRAEINQRADEHVAADAAEDVEIKRFHGDAGTFNTQHSTFNLELLHKYDR